MNMKTMKVGRWKWHFLFSCCRRDWTCHWQNSQDRPSCARRPRTTTPSFVYLFLTAHEIIPPLWDRDGGCSLPISQDAEPRWDKWQQPSDPSAPKVFWAASGQGHRAGGRRGWRTWRGGNAQRLKVDLHIAGKSTFNPWDTLIYLLLAHHVHN